MVDLSEFEIINEPDMIQASLTAVKLAHDGKADAEGLGAYSGSYISAPATSATILAESSAIISVTPSE